MAKVARSIIHNYFDPGLNYYLVTGDPVMTVDHYRTTIDGLDYIATREPVNIKGLEVVELIDDPDVVLDTDKL